MQLRLQQNAAKDSEVHCTFYATKSSLDNSMSTLGHHRASHAPASLLIYATTDTTQHILTCNFKIPSDTVNPHTSFCSHYLHCMTGNYDSDLIR